MLKPETFRTAHVTLHHMPYQMLAGHTEGGVLSRGRIIWTRDHAAASRPAHSTMAFVEEIGTVLIDSRWLRTAAPAAL